MLIDSSVRLRMLKTSRRLVQVIQADPHDSCALSGDISWETRKEVRGGRCSGGWRRAGPSSA